jgi:hypothetical protein
MEREGREGEWVREGVEMRERSGERGSEGRGEGLSCWNWALAWMVTAPVPNLVAAAVRSAPRLNTAMSCACAVPHACGAAAPLLSSEERGGVKGKKLSLKEG